MLLWPCGEATKRAEVVPREYPQCKGVPQLVQKLFPIFSCSPWHRGSPEGRDITCWVSEGGWGGAAAHTGLAILHLPRPLGEVQTYIRITFAPLRSCVKCRNGDTENGRGCGGRFLFQWKLSIPLKIWPQVFGGQILRVTEQLQIPL